jgi:choice-of-anchor C domain-containing protein
MPGWIVGGVSIDLVASYWQAASGLQSVNLNGLGAGSIYQDVPTAPGHAYSLSFALAGNPECGPTVKQMQVSWGSSVVAGLTFDVTGHSDASMGYQYRAYRVIASGPVTRLAFESLVGGACGPVLDDVSVTEVGVPSGQSNAVKTLLPPPNALLTGPFLPFAWNPYPQATYYDLQIWLVQAIPARPITASTITTFTARLTGTSYRLSVSAMQKGIYHWRMAATDASGAISSAWTPERIVTIQ